jgi:hypothetical protein
VILQIREKNRGKDNPSGRRCSLLPTMSSSERESRKLLRCKGRQLLADFVAEIGIPTARDGWCIF